MSFIPRPALGSAKPRFHRRPPHAAVSSSVPTPFEDWAFEVRRVEKPWGYELIWALTSDYCGKILFIEAGQSLSLQFHRYKAESWLVQIGSAMLELGEAEGAVMQKAVISAGDAFHYRPMTTHRLTAIDDTTILEVSTPQLDDVVRVEDAYGRAGTSNP
jgi:mannose-6-phosphate isomerase